MTSSSPSLSSTSLSPPSSLPTSSLINWTSIDVQQALRHWGLSEFCAHFTQYYDGEFLTQLMNIPNPLDGLPSTIPLPIRVKISGKVKEIKELEMQSINSNFQSLHISPSPPSQSYQLEFSLCVPVYHWHDKTVTQLVDIPSALSPSSLINLRTKIRDEFQLHEGTTPISPDRVKVYYLPNIHNKNQSKKLESIEDYRTYHHFYSIGNCFELFYYVVPQNFTNENKSPNRRKPPDLYVLTDMKNDVKTSERSPTSLSPDTEQLFQQEFADSVKERDKDEEKGYSYCVFCSQISDSLKIAYLYPSGMDSLKGNMPLECGGIYCLTNGVSACETCHGSFDKKGLIWVEEDKDSKQLICRVHPSALDSNGLLRDKVDGKLLRLPVRKDIKLQERLRGQFPTIFMWEWRKIYSDKIFQKTQKTEEEKLRKLEKKCSSPSNNPNPNSTNKTEQKCRIKKCEDHMNLQCHNSMCRYHCLKIRNKKLKGKKGCGVGGHKIK